MRNYRAICSYLGGNRLNCQFRITVNFRNVAVFILCDFQLRPLRSPSFHSRISKDARGGRLASRQHAGTRQNRHIGIRYLIHHIRGR